MSDENEVEVETDLHDELTIAYLNYYRAYEWWETKRSQRGYYACNKWLREIRKLAKQRVEENQAIFKNIGKEED